MSARYYSMGFNCRDGLYGVLTLGVRKGGELDHRELIEAFVRQASVALLRHHVRTRLRTSEERYRAVVESQRELICRFRPDGTVLFANDAWARFFDLDPAEVVGRRFAPQVPEGEQERLAAYFRSFGPASPEATIEHHVVLPDDSARWLQWHDRAFFDRTGTVAEYQSVGRDVTERREAEAALEELTADSRTGSRHGPPSWRPRTATSRAGRANSGPRTAIWRRSATTSRTTSGHRCGRSTGTSAS